MKILLLTLLAVTPVFAQNRSEAELRRLLRQSPQDAQAYSELIELATTREQIMNIGNEAIRAVGQRSQLYTAMGNAYMNARDYNNAVSAYRNAVNLNPRSATSYNRLGLALLRIGFYHQAEVAFRSAIAYSRAGTQSNLNYRANLAVAYENQKDITRARQTAAAVLAADHDNTTALEVQRRIGAN